MSDWSSDVCSSDLQDAANYGSPAIHWTADSRNVAVLLRAIDNKDRWIATVDTAKGTLQSRHRLTDPAWINWSFNDFGWMPVGAAEAANTLWYLSEESGHSHLYTVPATGGKPRALTSRSDAHTSELQSLM